MAEVLPNTTTVLRCTPLVRALHTAIRNKESSRRTFVSSSDRLVQMLIEEALGLLPATPVTVTTPCGSYDGVALPEESNIVAVSIMRAADCMLGVCRTMMPAVAVGKILIQRDEATALPVLLYSKLPSLSGRPVLLLDPMLATGGSCIEAVRVLIERGARPEDVVFVNILCCNEGLSALHAVFPTVRVVTSAVDTVLNGQKYIVPGLGDFGDRYFGTD
mmetsp:Transcript_25474/g.51761  ORF Transcript_25474/g.51761 Transcript_25474/m.51761 type:complete len:218 (+) Transcript_25474:27-680(+)